MYCVYIIISKKDGELYVGYTKDLKKRFEQHNKGLVDSTKARPPFELVYYEAYRNQQDATHREHNLKLRANALNQLKRRINKSLYDNR